MKDSNYSDDGDFQGEKNHDLDFCMAKKIVISFFFMDNLF